MLYKDFFESKIHFWVGKGTKVKFWEAKWCVEEQLQNKFPRLFEVSKTKGFTIVEMYTQGSGGVN